MIMESFKEHLYSWRFDDEGIPIFRSTEDALTYAHLIVDDKSACNSMKLYMSSVYSELDKARESGFISLQGLLNMACRCQLFRECVEEIQMIENERLSP